jgi:hypothetical protein
MQPEWEGCEKGVKEKEATDETREKGYVGRISCGAFVHSPFLVKCM